MTKEVKNDSPKDKLRPLSDKEWIEISNLVPELGDLRELCLEQRVSPTGVLGTVVATIGLFLQRGTRIEPFNANKPLPISNYVALVSPPGQGKSKSLHKGLPPWDEGMWEATVTASNPASGQGITNAAKSSQPFRKDKKGKELKSRDDKGVVAKPNILVTYEEGLQFENVTDSKLGSGMKGTLNAAWLGDAIGLCQNAATQEANRVIPLGTPITIGMVVCLQPGVAPAIVEDQVGLGARFLLFCPDPNEQVQRDLDIDNMASPDDADVLSSWTPLQYSKFRSKSVKARYPRGELQYVHLDPQIAALLTILHDCTEAWGSRSPEDWNAQLLRVAGQLKKLKGKRASIREKFASEVVNLLDMTNEMKHTVVKVARVAAGIAVYSNSKKITFEHVWAAIKIVTYCAEMTGVYVDVIAERRATEKREEGVGQEIARQAGRVYQVEQGELADMYVLKGVWKADYNANHGAFSAAALYDASKNDRNNMIRLGITSNPMNLSHALNLGYIEAPEEADYYKMVEKYRSQGEELQGKTLR